MFKSPIRSTTMIIIRRDASRRRPLTGTELPKRVLRGAHCRCAGCELEFNSLTAFDCHRAGEGRARRCLTRKEMRSRGMCVNRDGWWVTKIAITPGLSFEESAIASGALPYQGVGPARASYAPRELAEEFTH